jgi:hypothetical protein
MWWVKRLAVVWVALIALCGGAIALGRTDHTPNTLQALGFDVCDGEPCFRGVKIGDDWEKSKARFPEDVVDFQTLAAKSEDIKGIYITTAEDLITVHTIFIVLRNTQTLFTVQAFIMRYGIPCRVWLSNDADVYQHMRFYYRDMEISMEIEASPYDPQEFRLKAKTPVKRIAILTPISFAPCDMPTDRRFGVWHGFTSADVYLRHFLRESKIAGP